MAARRNGILVAALVGFALLVGGGLLAGRGGSNKVHAGDRFPDLRLQNIHGREVLVPDARSPWVHLQFRRFAGCPICNLHLQTFIARIDEIEEAGIREVVVFHSPDASLLPFQGRFPFDVVGDPEKKLYGRFGVETSIYSLLNPAAWSAIRAGQAVEDQPKSEPEGGVLGLPADILVRADGTVAASRYGRHAYDQWSVDEVLALARTR